MNLTTARIKELATYCLKEEETDLPHFGLEDEGNAGKAAIALAKGGITVDMEEAMGIFYFNFKDKKTCDRAQKIVAKVIDKSKESEW